MMELSQNTSILDLPWEDVLAGHVLPLLHFHDCLALRNSCSSFKTIVDSALKRLKIVRSWRAKYVSSHNLLVIASLTENLSRLDLSGCATNNDVVKAFLEKNKFITHLNLSGSLNLSEPAFLPLIRNKILRQFILVACHWVTTQFLITIGCYCPRLEFINVQGVLIDFRICASRFEKTCIYHETLEKDSDRDRPEFSFTSQTIYYSSRLEKSCRRGFQRELAINPTGDWIN